ncbi:MAG: hypothetical protein KJ645_09040, partial [Planctomycetes bacterium]|nr:hypothetical protein [Planctomycetota bacterium]
MHENLIEVYSGCFHLACALITAEVSQGEAAGCVLFDQGLPLIGSAAVSGHGFLQVKSQVPAAKCTSTFLPERKEERKTSLIGRLPANFFSWHLKFRKGGEMVSWVIGWVAVRGQHYLKNANFLLTAFSPAFS